MAEFGDPYANSLSGDQYNTTSEVTRGAATALPLNIGLPGLAQASSDSYDTHNQLLTKSELKNNSSFNNLIEVGSEWKAVERPASPNFYYRPTSFEFEGSISVDQIVAQVYSFCEREFTIEVANASPKEGSFDLGVFVNMALVCVKLQLWKESTPSGVARYVIEVEMRDGDPLHFGEVYRTMKRELKKIDAASRSVSEDVDFGLTELDLSMDKLLQFGSEIAPPEEEEWSSLLADCELLEDDTNAQVANAVESLCTIAQTYEPEHLKFLASQITAYQTGLSFPEDERTAVWNAGMKYQQEYAMAQLLKHMCADPGCVEEIVKLLPTLDSLIRKECQQQQATAEAQTWFTVVCAMCEAFTKIVTTANQFGVILPEDIKGMDMPVLPADDSMKNMREMVMEGKITSKSKVAQEYLQEAYSYIKV